jgi:hypothetical protein
VVVTPRELRQWSGVVAAMRALKAATAAAVEGDTATARARLLLVESSLEDLGERLAHDRRATFATQEGDRP